MPFTLGKARLEGPMLERLERRRGVRGALDARCRGRPPEPDWTTLAGPTLAGNEPRDATAIEALLSLRGARVDGAGELLRTARADGIRNELLFRARVHGWFAASEVAPEWRALNARVYDELLLTPARDPWLGLRDEPLWEVLEPSPRG